MRFPHAAALALVGWYLMVPPFSAKDVSYDKPLSDWQPVDNYSTKTECEEGKRVTVEKMTAFFAEAYKIPPTPKLKALQAGKCIATDDPRLKGQ
jgi:hypothetical protein